MNGNKLEISNGAGVDLSSIRITSLQATMDNIDGYDLTQGSRRLRIDSSSGRMLNKNEQPVVEYRGNARSGWTLIKDSRLLDFTIAIDVPLKTGNLDIDVVECTDMDNPRMITSGQDNMRFRPEDGRTKRVEFATPYEVSAGSTICYYVERHHKVDADDNNAASLVMMLES